MKDFVAFIQNYIWVPIVSALIGGFLSLFTPKLFKRIWNYIQEKMYKSVPVLNISGEWNSFFHEENLIQSEKVLLVQSGPHVSGEIILNNTKYVFNGEFKNSILSGTYSSKNPKKFESGAITVRRINQDLMSGYCTFIYRDKQIYNSPYVLSSVGSHNVKQGTYPFCNTCVGKFDCCCNCNEIDMPILLPNEADSISRISRKPIDGFAKKLTNNLYQMQRDSQTNGCVFFQNNRCTIYENRPIDCRLFPFDFKEIDGEYWIIYYDSISVCKAFPTTKEEIDCCAHNIRPLLDMVLPYMSECSDPIFSQKLKLQTYKKLFPIDKIRDDNIVT